MHAERTAAAVDLAQRGILQHAPWCYGTSHLNNNLDIYGPRKGSVDCLIVAAMHGDELDTTVMLSEALRMVPRDGIKNPVILCANPDGVLRGTRCNVLGVDLNRNWPADNWSPDPVRYKSHQGEAQAIELSPGKSPASEPETLALLKLVQDLSPRHIINLHSALGCIDDPTSSRLAHWIARQVQLEVVPEVGYATPGSFGSWAAERDQCIITWEFPARSLPELRKTHVPTLFKLITGDYELAEF